MDYSLAPEAPYPRALEECVFVYAWVLNNLESLGTLPNCVHFIIATTCSGTTGEKIILAGDSAGGYLALTMSMKINQLGLRPPNEIFCFYPPTLVCSAATPSRFLSIMDPLLPIGVLLSCLQVCVALCYQRMYLL